MLTTAVRHIFPRYSPTAAKVAWGNVRQITNRYGENLTYDVATLRNNSMVFAVFALVSLRTLVAYNSYHQAVGTRHEDLRRSEFSRTMVREYGGWLFSFFLYRQFEKSIQRWLLKVMNKSQVSRTKLGEVVKEVYQQLKAPFQGEPKNVDYYKFLKKYDGMDFSRLEVPDRPVQYVIGQKLYDRFINPLIDQMPGSYSSRFMKIQSFYNTFPMVAAFLPAFVLSGYVLERLTMSPIFQQAGLNLAHGIHGTRAQLNTQTSSPTTAATSPLTPLTRTATPFTAQPIATQLTSPSYTSFTGSNPLSRSGFAQAIPIGQPLHPSFLGTANPSFFPTPAPYSSYTNSQIGQ
ncbi:MAG: hypothetical protein KTR14_07295 [Vampirovibrio sp.]|nr:hypothetical protein [Vampirovibrio sp.]